MSLCSSKSQYVYNFYSEQNIEVIKFLAYELYQLMLRWLEQFTQLHQYININFESQLLNEAERQKLSNIVNNHGKGSSLIDQLSHRK